MKKTIKCDLCGEESFDYLSLGITGCKCCICGTEYKKRNIVELICLWFLGR